MLAALQAAAARGLLRPVDVQFARRLTAIGGVDDPALLLGAALVSQRAGAGDVCLPLAELAGQPVFAEADPELGLLAPPLTAWVAALASSPVVGRPGQRAPLILDWAGRLYLARYWFLEDRLAGALGHRIRPHGEVLDPAALRAGLDRLFRPVDGDTGPDWQRIAAAIALLYPLGLIVGGPGTGKTRTVASVLALVQERALATGLGTPLRIALAAPTGKAAARLSESIAAQKASLPVSDAVRRQIPQQAVTLHRLLGFQPGRSLPRHRPDNPLHLDLLVIDEASMVDLALMSRTLDALRPDARLILLGDRNQLSSVAAGMVLGDICGRGASLGYSADALAGLAGLGCALSDPSTGQRPPDRRGRLADQVVELRKSWRFDQASGIGALAAAVNRGDADRALQVLAASEFADVERIERATAAIEQAVRDQFAVDYGAAVAAADPAAALRALGRFRILCAVREGPFGVTRLNELVAATLEADGLLRPSYGFYPGMPVMVTANDHRQGLFNGDVGVILPDPSADGGLRCWMDGPDGLRKLLPSRLPQHQTLFAMTIHKSQGSEFDRVLLVLPDSDSPLLTRELVYTGITRARARVGLMAEAQQVASALARRVERATGLYERLWE